MVRYENKDLIAATSAADAVSPQGCRAAENCSLAGVPKRREHAFALRRRAAVGDHDTRQDALPRTLGADPIGDRRGRHTELTELSVRHDALALAQERVEGVEVGERSSWHVRSVVRPGR